MGQYFLIANTTKEEYLHPHGLGEGMKFLEIVESREKRALTGLALLLRQSSEFSAGDWPCGKSVAEGYLGRWAGDSIVLIGEYDRSGLFATVQQSYLDITPQVEAMLKSLNTYLP